MTLHASDAAASAPVYPLIINGQKVNLDIVFAVDDPATGAVVGFAPNAGEAELNAAVAAAAAAFPGWAARPDADRVAACHAIADKLEAHADELSRLITREQGKPLNGVGSRFEVQGAAGWCRYTAGLTLPVEVLQDGEAGRVEMHRKPVGVVGSITPWNWPMIIAVWHILPAIRSGCTVVCKPSPYTPLSTLRMVELMNEVLPAGVVNVVTADDKGTSLGGLISAHPDIRKVVFTGSTATGQKVMRSAAGTMKRLTLELGGNDAGIVLPDADPQAIAEGLFWGAFINMGQTCAALKRLYVDDSIHDAVVEALAAYIRNIPVGNGLEETSVMGPVANKMQFDKVAALVESARAKGTVVTGGAPGEGLFFPPTVITGLSNGDPLVDQEQFGPALPVIRYTDLEEAIRAANDSPSGLGGSVWSSDPEKARAVASRLECGTVWINKHGMIQPNAPFGGTKMSGLGVEFGQEGLLEYTDIQVMIL